MPLAKIWNIFLMLHCHVKHFYYIFKLSNHHLMHIKNHALIKFITAVLIKFITDQSIINSPQLLFATRKRVIIKVCADVIYIKNKYNILCLFFLIYRLKTVKNTWIHSLIIIFSLYVQIAFFIFFIYKAEKNVEKIWSFSFINILTWGIIKLLIRN